MPDRPNDAQMAAICDDLEAETEDLLALVRPLDTAALDQATPAEGWSIRDSISHLAFFDETGLLAAIDPDKFAESANALLKNLDMDAAGIRQGRVMDPATKVVTWFERARLDMIDAFRELDAKTRLPWYGPSMGALSFATARLMETWAHGQDIVDALGAIRTPTDRLRHIAHIGVRARPFSYATNGFDMPEGEIKIELMAPDGSTWVWNDDAGETNLVQGNALDFCLVVTQRRNIEDTDLDVHGELALDWMDIAQAFAGPPGAGREPGQFR